MIEYMLVSSSNTALSVVPTLVTMHMRLLDRKKLADINN
jgi:hypothetical protein